MDENNFPTRRPTFCIASIVITTIPLILMLVGTLRILLVGTADDSVINMGAEILLHLMFCALGGPFACVISILATYIAKERGESATLCGASRTYAKSVLFGCLVFLAILAIIAFVL